MVTDPKHLFIQLLTTYLCIFNCPVFTSSSIAMELSKHNKIEFSSLLEVRENVNDILIEISPLVRVYKDGRIERLIGEDIISAGVDPETGVQSKDVIISKEDNVWARLYIPKLTTLNKKLPLLIHFHGGGFTVENASSPRYHKYLNWLASQANVVVVSVNYRLAPEHSLPIAYDDSWCAIKWVASHLSRNGAEMWLNDHVDLDRVFLGGESAGANIAHNMAIRVGLENSGDFKLEGIILNDAFFWGSDAILGGKVVDAHGNKCFEKLWKFVNPETIGVDDPKFNPEKDPNLMKLGCSKVLILVAEKDLLRERGFHYYELLKKSGWKGSVEIMESKGEDHVFYVLDPTSDNALALFKRIASFINEEEM